MQVQFEPCSSPDGHCSSTRAAVCIWTLACVLMGCLVNVQASDSAAREQLEKVVEVLDTERCVTFDDCIAWARNNFQVPYAEPLCCALSNKHRLFLHLLLHFLIYASLKEVADLLQ
jgi:hypothetical protein